MVRSLKSKTVCQNTTPECETTSLRISQRSGNRHSQLSSECLCLSAIWADLSVSCNSAYITGLNCRSLKCYIENLLPDLHHFFNLTYFLFNFLEFIYVFIIYQRFFQRTALSLLQYFDLAELLHVVRSLKSKTVYQNTTPDCEITSFPISQHSGNRHSQLPPECLCLSAIWADLSVSCNSVCIAGLNCRSLKCYMKNLLPDLHHSFNLTEFSFSFFWNLFMLL